SPTFSKSRALPAGRRSAIAELGDSFSKVRVAVAISSLLVAYFHCPVSTEASFEAISLFLAAPLSVSTVTGARTGETAHSFPGRGTSGRADVSAPSFAGNSLLANDVRLAVSPGKTAFIAAAAFAGREIVQSAAPRLEASRICRAACSALTVKSGN